MMYIIVYIILKITNAELYYNYKNEESIDTSYVVSISVLLVELSKSIHLKIHVILSKMITIARRYKL